MNLDDATPEQILMMRLGYISDELRALPSEAFKEKHALNVEADEIRSALGEIEGDQSEILAEWAERAGRKGIPAIDEETLRVAVVRAKGMLSGNA